MKFSFRILELAFALLLLQACEKVGTEGEVIVDPYTFASKHDWLEDSIKIDNRGWAKIENGNVFSWMSQSGNLINSNFAIYPNRTNIKADFFHSIEADSVFAINLEGDSVFFLDANKTLRNDLKGKMTISSDTTLILNNVSASPSISIKYRLEK
jgi:hypothetical protein